MPTQVDPTKMADPDLKQTVANHHAEIQALGGRIHGVESGLQKLQGEVHSGFRSMESQMHTQIATVVSKLDKFEGRPQLNFHQSTQTVLALAILFSMIVAGIIYVSNAQFSGMIAKQESFNDAIQKSIDELGSRVGWAPSTKRTER